MPPVSPPVTPHILAPDHLPSPSWHRPSWQVADQTFTALTCAWASSPCSLRKVDATSRLCCSSASLSTDNFASMPPSMICTGPDRCRASSSCSPAPSGLLCGGLQHCRHPVHMSTERPPPCHFSMHTPHASSSSSSLSQTPVAVAHKHSVINRAFIQRPKQRRFMREFTDLRGPCG